MKVRMTIQISGTRNGADWPAAGETLDVTADESVQLVAAGLALPVAKAAETATARKPETRRGK